MRSTCATQQSAKKNVCKIDLCENGVQNKCAVWDLFESCVGLDTRVCVRYTGILHDKMLEIDFSDNRVQAL